MSAVETILSTRAPPSCSAVCVGSRTALVGCPDGSVHLWNLGGSASEHAVLKEASCSAAVTVIALDSADESVLVGHSDGSIRLWDLVAPSDPVCVLQSEGGAVSSLAFHPTSAFFLCSASSGGVLQVWDVREGACIQRHTVDANPVAHFSPHGRWVACGGASGHVIIIDLDDGAVVATLRRGEDRNVAVNAVAFSPVELLAAVAHENGHVAIWDLNEFSRVGDVNAGAKRGGSSFSGDGSALICAREGGVGIVRLDMPLRVESIEAQLGDNVAYVACEADDETGTVLAVGSDIRAVRIEFSAAKKPSAASLPIVSEALSLHESSLSATRTRINTLKTAQSKWESNGPSSACQFLLTDTPNNAGAMSDLASVLAGTPSQISLEAASAVRPIIQALLSSDNDIYVTKAAMAARAVAQGPLAKAAAAFGQGNSGRAREAADRASELIAEWMQVRAALNEVAARASPCGMAARAAVKDFAAY